MSCFLYCFWALVSLPNSCAGLSMIPVQMPKRYLSGRYWLLQSPRSFSLCSIPITVRIFVTPTRFWEFSTGGLLAMLPVGSKISVRMQNLMGWTGVVLIVIAGVNYSGDTAFPGYTALLPVVGSALFIHYGSHTPITGIYW